MALAMFNEPTILSAAETQPEADRWQFGGEVYLWGASIGGEDVAGDDIDIPFSDLWDNLDIAYMGKIAARKGKFSLVGDFIYLDVNDDITGSANIIGQPTRTKADVELTAYISTLAGGYSLFETPSSRLDVLIGARYLYLKADAKFDLGNFHTKISDSDHVIDGIVGLYGRIDLNPKWYVSCYADIGTGESKVTWQTSALVGYRFKRLDAVVGYRYLEYQFDDPEIIDNLNISGPFAGLRFKF